MGLVVIYTFIYAFFVIVDLIPLCTNKQWKSFWTYTALLTAAYALNTLIALKVKIPSPAVPIKNVVSAIFGLYF